MEHLDDEFDGSDDGEDGEDDGYLPLEMSRRLIQWLKESKDDCGGIADNDIGHIFNLVFKQDVRGDEVKTRTRRKRGGKTGGAGQR